MRTCVKNTPKPMREAKEEAWRRFCTVAPCRLMNRLIAANNFMRIAPREEENGPQASEKNFLSLVNGYWNRAASHVESGTGVSIIPFSEGYHHAGVLELPDGEKDCFSLLAHAAYQEGLILFVPPNTRVEMPLRIVQEVTKPLWAIQRLHIVVGKNSSLQIEEQAGSTQQAILNTLVTVDVGEEASLFLRHATYSTVTTCFSLRATVQKGASCDFCQVASSLSSRHSSEFRLAERANLSVSALSLLPPYHESHVRSTVTQSGKDSHVTQCWKGVVADDGQASHQMTAILQGSGSESRLESRFLTLGNRATVRHDPRFEILHDTVQASHGATTAAIDEESLFYLKSRGVGEGEAKALCIEGFCREFLPILSAQEIATMQGLV